VLSVGSGTAQLGLMQRCGGMLTELDEEACPTAAETRRWSRRGRRCS
jgi:hypothetical protein